MSNKETRYFNTNIEVRSENGEQKSVIGYGAVFGKLSENLGGFRELIDPNAFDDVMGDDVRFLFNHDANHIFGRTLAGTLKLSVDSEGLFYEVNMPETNSANELLVAMERGDVTQSSFAFSVKEDKWETKEGEDIRTITKVGRLYDVSAVTYPAYPDASVGLRSLEDHKKQMESLEADKAQRDKEEKDLHLRSLAKMKVRILKQK